MATLYVSHLDYNTTQEELEDAFKPYSPKEVKLIKTPIGYSRGFAFVEFATAEEAEKALEMNKKKLGKMDISVQKALPKGEKKPVRRFNQTKKQIPRSKRTIQKKPITKRESSQTVLFVKNLSYTLTEEDVKKLFEKYEVAEVKIIKRHSKKQNADFSKGFGFVTVKTAEAQKKAIAEMNGFEVEKRKIIVAAALEQVEREERAEKKERKTTTKSTEPKEVSENSLFVKNLPYKLTEEDVKKLFEKYEVAEVKIIKRHSKKQNADFSKGYGFVTVKTAEAQKKAIAEMNGFEVEKRKVLVAAAYKRVEKEETKTD